MTDRSIARHPAAPVALPSVGAVPTLDPIAKPEEAAARHGARTRRFPDGEKASLPVSVGPEEPGGLVRSGHTDVVPVTGQAWTGDSWTMRETGGRLVGRRATGMRGFPACMPAAMPLACRVHLAFSHDGGWAHRRPADGRRAGRPCEGG